MTEVANVKSGSFCSSCGSSIMIIDKYCSSCGTQLNIQVREIKQHHETFLVCISIFFTIVGGLIAYFKLRHDNPKLAKICLATGIILYIIGFIVISSVL